MGLSPDLVEIRWGYVVQAIEEVLELEVELRTYWDSSKMDVPGLREFEDVGDDRRPSDFVKSPAH